MKILIGLWHPAHVHTFKNAILNLQNLGHDVKLVAVDKDTTIQLLDLLGFEYEYLGESSTTIYKKCLDLIRIEYKLLRLVKSYRPDIFVGRGSLAMAHISKIAGIPFIAFIDSEPAWIIAPLQMPFIDVIITPFYYRRKLDPRKHIRVPSYKELAYLHPHQFNPDPSVLDQLGLTEKDSFSLVRFVGWDAYHDVGEYGFNIHDKYRLIDELERFGAVFISSEKQLPSSLKKFELKLPKDKIHSILYFSKLFIGDSQTMATEAAMLGTPAIRCNSFVGQNDMSNFIELENNYELILNFNLADDAISAAIALMKEPNLKHMWKERQEKMLNDKIDLTNFLVRFIDDYPKSFIDLKKLS